MTVAETGLPVMLERDTRTLKPYPQAQ